MQTNVFCTHTFHTNYGIHWELCPWRQQILRNKKTHLGYIIPVYIKWASYLLPLTNQQHWSAHLWLTTMFSKRHIRILHICKNWYLLWSNILRKGPWAKQAHEGVSKHWKKNRQCRINWLFMVKTECPFCFQRGRGKQSQHQSPWDNGFWLFQNRELQKKVYSKHYSQAKWRTHFILNN